MAGCSLDDQVDALFVDGYTMAAIARQLGVTVSKVRYSLHDRHSYGRNCWQTCPQRRSTSAQAGNYANRGLDKRKLRAIIARLRKQDVSDVQIAAQLEIDSATVRRIAGLRNPPIEEMPCTPCTSCGKAAFIDRNPFVRGRCAQCAASRSTRSIGRSQRHHSLDTVNGPKRGDQ